MIRFCKVAEPIFMVRQPGLLVIMEETVDDLCKVAEPIFMVWQPGPKVIMEEKCKKRAVAEIDSWYSSPIECSTG